MSGRRAAAAPSRTGARGRVQAAIRASLALLRLLGPTQLALAAVLVGVVLVMVGLGLRWSGSDGATRTVRLDATSVVSARPDRLSRVAAVAVQAHTTGASTVFVGVARDDDARAYLDSSAWQEQTGPDDGARTAHPGSAPLSDPRLSDVWVSFAAQPGEASLAWPSTPGSWRIVATTVAPPGAAPTPLDVTLSWSGTAAPRGGAWWISGLVLGGLGLIGLAVLRGLGRSGVAPSVTPTSARVRARAGTSAPAASSPREPAASIPAAQGDPDRTMMIPLRGLPDGVGQAPPYVPVPSGPPAAAVPGADAGADLEIHDAADEADEADDDEADDDEDEPPVRPFRRSGS
ncbi:MAG: hypothetical protein U0Q19_06645 [Kineosporiaceae bacterium]